MSSSRRPWVAISVMLVILLKSTWNHEPRVLFVTQASLLFRRALCAGQHDWALLAVKERSCSPSGELHSTEDQQQRKVFTNWCRLHLLCFLTNETISFITSKISFICIRSWSLWWFATPPPPPLGIQSSNTKNSNGKLEQRHAHSYEELNVIFKVSLRVKVIFYLFSVIVWVRGVLRKTPTAVSLKTTLIRKITLNK